MLSISTDHSRERIDKISIKLVATLSPFLSNCPREFINKTDAVRKLRRVIHCPLPYRSFFSSLFIIEAARPTTVGSFAQKALSIAIKLCIVLERSVFAIDTDKQYPDEVNGNEWIKGTG